MVVPLRCVPVFFLDAVGILHEKVQKVFHAGKDEDIRFDDIEQPFARLACDK